MKRTVYYSMAVLCAGMLMAACATTKRTTAVVSLEGEWDIVEVEGKPISVTDGKPLPFIGFNQDTKRIYGNSGCNRMMGTYQVDSTKPGFVRLGQIASTRMACPDMETESRVLAALGKVSSFKAVEGTDKAEGGMQCVMLCADDGHGLMLLEKQQKDGASAAALLDGQWTIKTVNGRPVGKAEQTPFVGFDVAKGLVYGTAGCNNLTGSLVLDEENPEAIDLSKLATTQMLCADMATEDAVLQALRAVVAFRVDADGQLSLYNKERQVLLTLVRR